MLRSRAAHYLIAAAVLLLLGGAGTHRLVRGSASVFLPTDTGADWIARATPTQLNAQPDAPQLAGFRTKIRVADRLTSAPLEVYGLGDIRVELDGQVLSAGAAEGADDSGGHAASSTVASLEVELAPHLSPGDHLLVIKVANRLGPPLLAAHVAALDVRTGLDWEVTVDGAVWEPVRLAASGVPLAGLSMEFPHAGRTFVTKLNVFIPMFALIFVVCLTWGRLASSGAGHWLARLTPSGLRWFLLLIWSALAANNIGKVAPHIGMDLLPHLVYIQYLVEEGRIPLATQGGEMMQSPLYYLISAPLYQLFSAFYTPDAVVRLLRVVPMACGIAQVEVCYRAVRAAFPARNDLQMLGLLVGGLLPMNIALSHAVANEPLAGLTGGIVIVLLLQMLRSETVPSVGTQMWVGVACGLALPSKMSGVLLGPVVLYAVVARFWQGAGSTSRVVRVLLVVGMTAAVVSGWYYVRNWILIGSPFLGTWESSQEVAWWQEPGYRTIPQFLRFGQALTYPFFSAVTGVWDGLYSSLWLDGYLSGQTVYGARPLWNFSYMLAGAWFALVPTLLIAVGSLRAWMPATEEGASFTFRSLRLSTICVGTYLAAILYMNATVTFYCVAKSSYMAAATPALAVLVAGGAAPLTRLPAARAAVVGALCCFAACAYAAFFVV